MVIPEDLYVRDFVSARAFDALDPRETFYALGPAVSSTAMFDPAQIGGRYEITPARRDDYKVIRRILLTTLRKRSRTQAVKLSELPRKDRWYALVEALPGVRHLRVRRRLKRTGLNASLVKVIEDVRPELIVVPSSGTDVSIADAVRAGQAMGIEVLGVMYNWDNLSSKAAFTARPRHLAVVGEQSAEHAQQIHDFEAEQVHVVGSPYIDRHFRHELGSTESPYPFPYVLFAGCYQPFDERTALEALDACIEREGLGLKVVYLPHPRRLARQGGDRIDESRLRHVMIEPRVREGYLATQTGKQAKTTPLPLDAYAPLIENARFVVCPLSTMMLEAAILGRRVLVIAHHDGIHRTSPGVAIEYLHFERVDALEHFSVSRRAEDLGPLFVDLARAGGERVRPLKEQTDYWVYHDERPFGERLAEVVARVGG